MTRRDLLQSDLQDLVDGSLDEAAARDLAAALRDDPALVDTLCEFGELHSALHRLAETEGFSLPEAAPVPLRRRPFTRALAAAAILLLAVAAGLWMKHVAAPDTRSFLVSHPGAAFTIERSSEKSAPGELHDGDRVTLSRGRLECWLRPGVHAMIVGPADFTLGKDDRLKLDQGTAWFLAAEEVEKFTVVTPDLVIEDLGTEFGVVAAADAYDEAHLFAGEIRVTARHHLAESRTLKPGESVHADVVGRLHTPLENRRNEFAGLATQTKPTTPDTMRKLTLPASVLVVAAAAPSEAALFVDFESGSASYDNATSQTTGLFRDINNGASINLSSNGVGIDFLQVAGSGSSSGVTPRTAIYDTTPATVPGGGGSEDLLVIGVGQTGQLSYDLDLGTGAGSQPDSFALGLVDPASSHSAVGFYSRFDFRRSNDPNHVEGIRIVGAGDRIGGFQTSLIDNTASLGNTWTNTGVQPYRLVFDIANNGSSIALTLNIYSISGLEGSVTSSSLGSTTGTVNVGTGTGEVDINLATGANLLFTTRNGRDGVTLDNIGFTVVPEPSSVILGSGLALLLLRRRRG